VLILRVYLHLRYGCVPMGRPTKTSCMRHLVSRLLDAERLRPMLMLESMIQVPFSTLTHGSVTRRPIISAFKK